MDLGRLMLSINKVEGLIFAINRIIDMANFNPIETEDRDALDALHALSEIAHKEIKKIRVTVDKYI